MLETSIRYIIDKNLENKEWILDPRDKNRNVFLENDLPSEYKSKIKNNKRPDYTLFHKGKPIAIIEAKKSGENLEKALEQATQYAKELDAPLIFASNGSYCETRHLYTGERLKLNNNEVKELLRHKEAIKFIENPKSNEAYTIPKEIIKDRDELIRIFSKINITLRSEGIQAGYDRFSEFSNILFIKLLSEGKNGDHDLWNILKAQPDETLIHYLNNTLIVSLRKKYGGEVLEKTEIDNVRTLRSIISYLDPLLLSPIDIDIKGGAFEYFIEKSTSTNKDLGEYYTPRHIIKSIIHLVNPQFNKNIKETIYDPFCGTGGFLTTAFNYIRENNKIEGDDLEILRKNCIYGNELTKTSRIAKMNMVLHGDGHSGVTKGNTLLKPIKNKYDIVATNIPFAQNITYEEIDEKTGKPKTKNDITDLYNEGLAKNSGDGVCVLHCFNALKKGGRMAVIVPEGFLYDNKLKQVRSYLLGNAKLQSVLSLPQGVFLPYTNVKTYILYFTDCHYKNDQKEYWYFDVKSDGYSLDTQRRKLDGDNDLNKLNASNIDYEKEKDILQDTGFHLISMEAVKENNYNLIGNFYLQNYKVSTEYEMVKLGDVCDLIHGITYKKKVESHILLDDYISIATTRACQKDGIIKKDLKFIPNKNIDEKKIIVKNDILISLANSLNLVGRTTFITDIDYKCTFGTFMGMIRSKNNILQKYLYYQLNSKYSKEYFINNARTTTSISNLNFEILNNLTIPLPSLEKQKLIIDEIEAEEKIIEENKKLIIMMENKIQKRIDDIWK